MNKGIQKIFSSISEKYELINHIITFGFDIRWRKYTAKRAVKNGHGLFLDVCTGTGEMASYLKRFAGKESIIVAIDFCMPMLKKALSKRKNNKIKFVLGDAGKLPFKNDTFDIVTISFATRNLNFKDENLKDSLREFRRVLKKGGKFYNLETSQPKSKILKFLLHLYVKKIVKLAGYLISHSEPAYAYLAHTIPRFHDSETLLRIFLEAGFSKVIYKKFLFGIASLHIAEK